MSKNHSSKKVGQKKK